MRIGTTGGIKWLLAALAMTGVAGGVLAASNDASAPATDAAAPALPQAAPDHGAGDHRAPGPDGAQHPYARRGGGWEHRGWHGHRARHGWHRHGRRMMRRPAMMGPALMLDAPMLRAFRQLNLTADQRQKLRTIVLSARQQSVDRRRGAATASQNLAAILNPGDPNYASAVQAAQQRAVARIQQASQTQRSLYNVLTSEQKTKLTQVMAQRRARMQRRFGPPGAGVAPPAPPA